MKYQVYSQNNHTRKETNVGHQYGVNRYSPNIPPRTNQSQNKRVITPPRPHRRPDPPAQRRPVPAPQVSRTNLVPRRVERPSTITSGTFADNNINLSNQRYGGVIAPNLDSEREDPPVVSRHM